MKTLSFKGSGLEYFKIWIVNILLTIITLGIYYPWAKVRNNRYFYGNSVFGDKNFEYHATGKQLFFAYLIALALFIIFQVVSSFSQYGTLFLLVLFFIAIPWIIWRSMRFNMNITSFSNVRFKFEGELGKSYLIFLAYPLLFLIGVALLIASLVFLDNTIIRIVGVVIIIAFYLYAISFFTEKNISYLLNSSKYGQGKFKTNLEINSFFKIMLKTMFLNIGLIVLLLLLLSGISYFIIDDFALLKDTLLNMEKPENKAIVKENLMGMIPLFILGYVLLVSLGTIVLSYYITKKREYVFSNTSLDDNIKFSSSLKFLKLTFIIITNLFATIFTLGLAIPWAKVRMARYMLENTHIISNGDLTTYINTNEMKMSALGEEMGDVFDVDIGLPL